MAGTPRKMTLGAVAMGTALLAVAGAGCGGMQPPPSGPPSFGAVVLTSASSASGTLHIDLRSSPQPPVRGDNAAQLTFTDGSGAPVTGLALAMTPWMPAHDHGTSILPGVSDDGTADGVYVATPLYLYMAGRWQLQVTITGSVDDTATFNVDIP